MRYIGRPGRQRPWWLAVGMLTCILFFTVVSAAPARSDGTEDNRNVPAEQQESSFRPVSREIQPVSGNEHVATPRARVSEIHSASSSDDEFDQVPQGKHPASSRLTDHSASSLAKKNGALHFPSAASDLNFAGQPAHIANEVPVTDGSYQDPGRKGNKLALQREIKRILRWREATQRVDSTFRKVARRWEETKSVRQQLAEAKRLARLQKQPGEIEVSVRHQLTQQEIEARRSARVAAEAEEPSPAAAQESEAAAAAIARSRAESAPATPGFEPEEERTRHHGQPTIFERLSSGNSRYADAVVLSRSPSSPRDAFMLFHQAEGRSKEGAGVLTDVLHGEALPKLSLSEMDRLRLVHVQKRGDAASSSESSFATLQYKGEGWKNMSNGNGQIFFHRHSPYKDLGFRPTLFEEWDPVSQEQIKKLVPGVKKLKKNGWDLSKLKAKETPVIGEWNDRSLGTYHFEDRKPQRIDIRHGYQGWQFSHLTRNGKDRVWAPFDRLPQHLQEALRWESTLAGRSAWKSAIPHRPLRKRFVTSSHLDGHAVDEGPGRGAAGSDGASPFSYQDGPRELSGLQRRGSTESKQKYKPVRSSAASSSAGLSSQGYPIEPPLEVQGTFYYPGKRIVISRLGRGRDLYHFNLFPETGTMSYQSYSWSRLPPALKEALIGSIEHLDTVAGSDLPAEAAERHNIRLAPHPLDTSYAYEDPRFPSESIEISRNGQGNVVFKRPNRSWVTFGKLDRHLRMFMENADRTPLLDEAVRAYEAAKGKFPKRAVDTDAEKEDQVEWRADPSPSSHLTDDPSVERKLSTLQKRGGKYSSTGDSSEAGPSSAGYSRIDGERETFDYPGRLITITYEGLHSPPFLFHELNEDRTGRIQSYKWPQLPDDVRVGLTKQAENLPTVMQSSLSARGAEAGGVKIASSLNDVSKAYRHPLYRPETIKLKRKKPGKVAFKRPGGQWSELDKLPGHLRSYMEKKAGDSGLLAEAVGKDLRTLSRSVPPRPWKRAVDIVDDKAHQVQRQVISSTGSEAGPSTSPYLDGHTEAMERSRGATVNSSASSSPDPSVDREALRLQKRADTSSGSSRIFGYPGQKMSITRADKDHESYELHLFRESEESPYGSGSWSVLPAKFKRVVAKKLPFLPAILESGVSARDARLAGIKVASEPFDPNNMYFHPSYPAENIAISRDGQGNVVFKRGGRAPVPFSQLPPHLRSYMQEVSNPPDILRDTISTSDPLPSVSYPGEHILVTRNNDGRFWLHELAPQRGQLYTHNTERLNDHPRASALMSLGKLRVARNIEDLGAAIENPEKGPEQIHIEPINGQLWYQRQTPYVTHEPVIFDELPEYLQHYLLTSPEALQVKAAATRRLGPLRKRAISESARGDKVLQARAGQGLIPTVTLGESGPSSAPRARGGQKRTWGAKASNWFENLVNRKASSSSPPRPSGAVVRHRTIEFPGQGIKALPNGRGGWAFTTVPAFYNHNVYIRTFEQLNDDEKKLLQGAHPGIPASTDHLPGDETGSGPNTRVAFWPEQGPELIHETTRTDGLTYSRQTRDGRPIGDKPFFLSSELPEHLRDFIETEASDLRERASMPPHLRKRTISDTSRGAAPNSQPAPKTFYYYGEGFHYITGPRGHQFAKLDPFRETAVQFKPYRELSAAEQGSLKNLFPQIEAHTAIVPDERLSGREGTIYAHDREAERIRRTGGQHGPVYSRYTMSKPAEPIGRESGYRLEELPDHLRALIRMELDADVPRHVIRKRAGSDKEADSDQEAVSVVEDPEETP
ncbi:hypothetical protein EX895_000853 [Sporisorium graminicola]|uniref:Uncharacterized protein n=1 Tax=Sporisorium graminicola TaxID=280036 RepID=A0A4U7L101_9BASI|nr:hypothetical protein EX895_000853 [Sporisorium graminicola]TKY90855.1 hypothetical protein EX895_000853 [Sporisorium graminicola]